MANLQTLLDDFNYDSLPPAWTTGDLASFSRGKTLWPYQQDALRHALLALWLYYDGEADEAQRKRRFFRRYTQNDIPLPALLNVGRKRDQIRLLQPYYTLSAASNGDRHLAFAELINRMGFWMATGSGKTLVIVKLLQQLWTLMHYELIPRRGVMVLTHREDLLQQLRSHVREYNSGGAAPLLRLRDLREYPEARREHPSLLGRQELTVFTYRSDNLSDTQKERIVDYRNYEDDGQWYVLLDEAHKGDKEDSKRQHIYNILSRNGFLFNFSATFTDPRDRLTTAYEFNLASFIQGGYGKHIGLLRQENRAFKAGEEYTDEEKQRIVLQSLLMLAYVAKARARLCAAAGATLYHRPLLLALVNSVNTEEADLKLFFRELARIGNGDITLQAFAAAKRALRDELAAGSELMYEEERLPFDAALFDSLTRTDIYRYVFNAERRGAMEVLVRPSNDKELAFKLKSTAEPFALIKIGDSTPWRKGELAGYEIVQGFEDDSFFARLNEADSTVNLLMGSRSFYEGWDSNRPNVITFINIGTGDDAQKFVLQSVGRGVRIEPLPGKRKRLQSLHTMGEVDDSAYEVARPFLHAVESLFIFGTKRAALETILQGLAQEQAQAAGSLLELEVSPAAQTAPHPILIPVFRQQSGRLLVEQREPRPFELRDPEQKLLHNYVQYLTDDGDSRPRDDRLLLAHHGLTPQQIGLLHKTLAQPDTYFFAKTERRFGRVEVLLPRLMQYFAEEPRVLEGFKPLGDEINHFRHIRVTLTDISELRTKINLVRNYEPPVARKAKLREQRNAGVIDEDAYDEAVVALSRVQPSETFDYQGQRLHIMHLAAHYFLPLLVSDAEKLDYINHVIRTPSERRFINQLEAYLKEGDNLFTQYDWWRFSRTDETLDRVVLPYYDGSQGRMRSFHPDFVFWLVKGQEYTLLFVDPKGMKIGDYQYKIDGYREHFRDGASYRLFKHGDYQVRVALLMYHDGPEHPAEGYASYWCNSPQAMLQKLSLPPTKTG